MLPRNARCRTASENRNGAETHPSTGALQKKPRTGELRELKALADLPSRTTAARVCCKKQTPPLPAACCKDKLSKDRPISLQHAAESGRKKRDQPVERGNRSRPSRREAMEARLITMVKKVCEGLLPGSPFRERRPGTEKGGLLPIRARPSLISLV